MLVEVRWLGPEKAWVMVAWGMVAWGMVEKGGRRVVCLWQECCCVGLAGRIMMV